MTVAHIHGRFQPFHREHADYARWAARDCSRLIVGITNADPSHIEPEDAEPKRHKPKHNPFTYFERHQMIQKFLQNSAIDCDVSIVPFPINKPELWHHYVPESVTHYVNILEQWHEIKVKRIESYNREVVTKRGERTVSSESIRERIANGQEWESDVPTPVAKFIIDIGGDERVKELFQ